MSADAVWSHRVLSHPTADSGLPLQVTEGHFRLSHGLYWSSENAMAGQLHRLDVDHSEQQAALLDVVRRSGAFDVRMVRLTTGDYLINEEVLIERKTISDFAASLADGRLFTQAARLAHSAHRSILLIEGPTPAAVPAVHPHALEGALVSLAVMWRLPVLHSLDPEHSARILEFLANQASKSHQQTLRRFDRKPKRLLRGGSLCSRACPASGLRLPADSWLSSAPSKASSPPKWTR